MLLGAVVQSLKPVKLADGHNNSQHCWANNVGSCCVHLHVDVAQLKRTISFADVTVDIDEIDANQVMIFTLLPFLSFCYMKIV